MANVSVPTPQAVDVAVSTASVSRLGQSAGQGLPLKSWLTVLGGVLVSTAALVTTVGSRPALADGVVVIGGNGGLAIHTPGFGLSIGNPYHRHYYPYGYATHSRTYRFPQTTYSTTTYSVNGGQTSVTISNPQVHPYPNLYYPHPGVVIPSHSGTRIYNTRVIRGNDPRPVNVAPLN